MDFRKYQRSAFQTNTVNDPDIFLLGLVDKVGGVFSAYKRAERDHQNVSIVKAEFRQQIGDALWYLAAIASSHNISLDAAAKANLDRARNAFLLKTKKYYDSKFRKSEQIPRKMVVWFKPINAHQVAIEVDGQPVGDDLDDNIMSPDGYRYHDVFHLGYAVHLRWSPVWRHLINAKRQSSRNVRRVQDGARARIVEEAVAALLFAEQKTAGLSFENENDIPYSTLEIVKRITNDFEVRTRTIKEWRSAIADGFRMFRLLRENRGGFVTANLTTGRMTFRKFRRK
jgi:hypothetical protein